MMKLKRITLFRGWTNEQIRDFFFGFALTMMLVLMYVILAFANLYSLL